LAALCLFLASAARLTAQEPGPSTPAEKEESEPEKEKVFELGGFIDLYYSHNDNRPAGHTNFFPGAGVAAKRAEEFALNWAALEIRRDPDPVGFRLVAAAGNAVEVLHSGEPEGETVGRDELRHVYRASVSYAVSDRLLIEGGIYPSHIGFESALPRDNWNYTGSWTANFSPYYQTGVKAVWSFADGWSAGLHVVNGWQVIADNNDAKSLGAHLGWSSERSSVTVNGWAGPELPDDDSHQRTLLDLVATTKVTDALSVAFEGYLGRQELPETASASWSSLAGYARYQLNPEWAAAVRVERFDDPDGGISGLSQTIEEGTLTFEHRPHEKLLLKLEGRYDRSTEPIFNGEVEEQGEKNQLLLVLGSIVTF
jgi:hypothetical protein